MSKEVERELDLPRETEPDREPPIAECEAENAAPCEENMPNGRWQRILYSVYRDKTVCEILRVLSYAIVVGTVYAFLYNMVLFIQADYMQAIRYAVVCGVPFIIVSVMRRVINMPRPYEVYSFYDEPPKKKQGRSFPSRHVFSVFVIGSALMFESVFIGFVLCLLGAVLALCRVLLGIHFVKDTVAGALIGIAGGVLGMLITGAFF